MTNDPKGFCLTCGNGPLHPDGIHSCRENPVLAHLKARIAELEAWVKETNSLLRGASNKIVELLAERATLRTQLELTPPTIVDTCDLGHRFAKISPDRTPCPVCLAIGLSNARAHPVEVKEEK